MYDRVLIPTDGSEGMAETLTHGLDLAERHGATVHALYVVDRRQYLGAPEDTAADLRETLEERGEEAVAEIVDAADDAGVEVVSEVREGVPHKAILEYVEEAAVDVIVMGTHGRTGRDRLATLGSVSERVIKNASIPVLVVDIGDEGV